MRILRWIRTEEAKRVRRETGSNSFRDKYLTYDSPDWSNTITTVQKDNLLLFEMEIIKLGYYSNSQNGLIVSVNGIAPCVCSGGNGHDANMPKILVCHGGKNVRTER